MATQFSGAAVTAQPTPFQHGYKKSTQLYGQTDSGRNTPMNVSPTSPRTTGHLPHYPQHAPSIRPLRTPNYIPAALRKTEKPAGRSPPKADSSLDASTTSWSASGSFGQSPGDSTPISRIATEDMRSIYDDTPLSPVTGPITRNHWQPDSSTVVCTASCCQQPFGFFMRRHHCRKCGGIFCHQHLQKQVRLNEDALFHPEGEWQKACDRCHTQFREWEQMRSSRTNSESSGSIKSPTPTAVEIEPPQAKRPECAPKASFLSQSFGGGTWNWSTF
ncbi:hypothetical protein BU23DRAFT_456402 [Bimuria novae-zelandiae CBS 107.79]|uniref:FYVE-type domain-containing protein n=1 Tax=Bimuria novae-zelandiae CBS 107.79 TaxID=1447943 RepID=A0A6A5VFY2_9PLEO|nr:hypothetical protein BU23DRAFT_456402 [Bimuria novae-zelandiae CBS 107.79]